MWKPTTPIPFSKFLKFSTPRIPHSIFIGEVKYHHCSITFFHSHENTFAIVKTKQEGDKESKRYRIVEKCSSIRSIKLICFNNKCTTLKYFSIFPFNAIYVRIITKRQLDRFTVNVNINRIADILSFHPIMIIV